MLKDRKLPSTNSTKYWRALKFYKNSGKRANPDRNNINKLTLAVCSNFRRSNSQSNYSAQNLDVCNSNFRPFSFIGNSTFQLLMPSIDSTFRLRFASKNFVPTSMLGTLTSLSFINHAQTNLQHSPFVLSFPELPGLFFDQGSHILGLLDLICRLTSARKYCKETLRHAIPLATDIPRRHSSGMRSIHLPIV